MQSVQPREAGGASAPPVAIEIRGLSTTVEQAGRQVAIHRNLDLTVFRSEIFSIVGGTGSGKTLLLRQILGLQRPSEGTIQVLGQAAPAASGASGPVASIGMLFQQGALFSAFTVLENIAFPLSELGRFPRRLVNEAAMVKLQLVGLDARDAGKKPSQLSGGMIKRVALARALILDPPLLLLDEPTTGVDPGAADALVKLLASLHRRLDLTILMVSHDLDALYELSTRIAMLADQHVVACGRPWEVVAVRHPFIEAFFLGNRGQRAMEILRQGPLTI